MRAQSFQHFFQGIRGMRVIHHHQRQLTTAKTLHTPDRALQLRQEGKNFIQRVVQTKQRANYGQQVAQVEATEQRAAQIALALRGHQTSTHTVIIETGFAAIDVSRAVIQAVADQPRLMGRASQLAAKDVVQIDHPATQIRPGEQFGLGGAVGFHRTVIVEVIARQVGEHCHVEVQCGYAALLQAVGGNFHGHGASTGLLEVGKDGLHRYRIRRGVAAAFQSLMEAGTQGADDTATLAKQVQGLGQQLADAGLAVGAGDANQTQSAARLTVETPGDG